MEELKTLRICRLLLWGGAAAYVIAFLVFLIGGWTYDAPVTGGHWSEPEVVCKSDVGPCGETAPVWVEEKDYSEAPLYARVSHDYSFLLFLSLLILPILFVSWAHLEDKITLKEKSLCELPRSHT